MEDHVHNFATPIVPPSGGRRWYLCACGVVAHKKGNRLVAYRCMACGGEATHRLPGRGPRAGYLWVCGEGGCRAA